MDHVKVLVYIFLEIFMGKEKINYFLLLFLQLFIFIKKKVVLKLSSKNQLTNALRTQQDLYMRNTKTT